MTPNVGKNVKKLDHSHIAGENVNWPPLISNQDKTERDASRGDLRETPGPWQVQLIF